MRTRSRANNAVTEKTAPAVLNRINDVMGHREGIPFESEEQVREYFSVQSLLDMKPGFYAIQDSRGHVTVYDLDGMPYITEEWLRWAAEVVITHRDHCAF